MKKIVRRLRIHIAQSFLAWTIGAAVQAADFALFCCQSILSALERDHFERHRHIGY